MSVGTNIKRRRFELKMSQQELADAMGYKSRSTIAKIESGENDVSQKKLNKFANVLDTTPEALISGYSAVSDSLENKVYYSNSMRTAAIILAGGKSGRNRQNVPSQFVDINGKPIIVYSMEAYEAHPSVDDIYIVCLKGWENIVRDYAKQFRITKLKGIIIGASSGILSLRNAVNYIATKYEPDDHIIIQEATRPLVKAEMISKLIQACEEKGTATTCHSMKDYVQFVKQGGKAKYVNRNSVIALQSPEMHRLSLLTEVFKKADSINHDLIESCCTMLLYNLGYPINFVESNVNNIKISREEDIATFGALVKR